MTLKELRDMLNEYDDEELKEVIKLQVSYSHGYVETTDVEFDGFNTLFGMMTDGDDVY